MLPVVMSINKPAHCAVSNWRQPNLPAPFASGRQMAAQLGERTEERGPSSGHTGNSNPELLALCKQDT